MITNPVTGATEFSYPIVEAKGTGSGPLLIFAAVATRCGGLLPDELPFNIGQKILRRVLPFDILPDLDDSDYRKQFQNTWYGTNEEVELPFGLSGKKRSTTGAADGEKD
eukprot:2012323-Prymnesium_polylepis.1